MASTRAATATKKVDQSKQSRGAVTWPQLMMVMGGAFTIVGVVLSIHSEHPHAGAVRQPELKQMERRFDEVFSDMRGQLREIRADQKAIRTELERLRK